ncbi:MAG: hypothetical protein B7Z37_10300 [Verrucomicrobia bacterium 12-59-8]|nr:MAG: hypothetical protein B7Z37_10300 [Verrucomicrobia bacterium 12-59-8]
MTLNTISDPPVSPAPAATPRAARPSTADAAPPAPASLTSPQLMAVLGVSRRILKNWNHRGVIPSVRVGTARRYDLAQVMEALCAHGQPAPAASPAPPGLGGPAGEDADS